DRASHALPLAVTVTDVMTSASDLVGTAMNASATAAAAQILQELFILASPFRDLTLETPRTHEQISYQNGTGGRSQILATFRVDEAQPSHSLVFQTPPRKTFVAVRSLELPAPFAPLRRR